MKIGHGWLNLSTWHFLLSQGCFDISARTERKITFPPHFPCRTWTNHPLTEYYSKPQAAFPTGHLSLYWPERAGGRLQCGWGRTYSHRCGPHWCKWQPDETASPLPCHYRGWEQVQLAPVQNPHKQCDWIARIIAAIMCRWICPWWRRFRQELV